jgi:hypothetical protein
VLELVKDQDKQDERNQDNDSQDSYDGGARGGDEAWYRGCG